MAELLTDSHCGSPGCALISFPDQNAHRLTMKSQAAKGNHHDQGRKRQNDEDEKLKSQPLPTQAGKEWADF